MQIVAGVGLGGTAINYALVSVDEEFLIDGLCEHPSRVTEGPEVCMRQIEDGLHRAVERAGVDYSDLIVVGLDTPGPASAEGVLSARGSTNFAHLRWVGFDIRGSLAK